MRNKRVDSRERLLHIQKAILDIERYTADLDLIDFLKSDMTQDAVLLQFIIIGEAIVHVESDILDKYQYPWYKVRAFRNFIAHEYFNIKMSTVWETVQQDLNGLKVIINEIIETEF
jgi:uncharacterized protein with HEPN domain